MTISDKAIKALEKLGFKEYQARVYCALVRLGQASAPEIHKISGVPRPRVYDTLMELIEFGAVNYRKGRPALYKAVEPALIVERLRHSYLSAGDDAIQELEKLTIQSLGEVVDYMWMLRGHENIRGKIKELLMNARKEIFIKFAKVDEYIDFFPHLALARKKGVHVKSLLFGSERITRKNKSLLQVIDFGRIDPDVEDNTEILATFKDIFITRKALTQDDLGIIIIDSKESLVLFNDKTETELAVWSSLPLMVIIQGTIFNYIWRLSKKK